MKKTYVFMYSGQGSQYYNMGRDFYYSDPIFKENMDKLDKVFNSITGLSVIEELYADGRKASESFDQILYTHSAIFMTEYSLTQVLVEKGIKPDFVLGSSLGEFTAGVIAGVMSAEDMLENLITQAQILERTCEEGGMLTVVEKPEIFYENPIMYGNTELASLNFGTHFVVSGSEEDLDEVEEFLSSKEIINIRLPVKYPFHSSLVEVIAPEYTKYLKNKVHKAPNMGMVSCMTGSRITEIDNSYYWNVVRRPMNFPIAMSCLEKEGDCIYIDLGPSGTMANFAKYNAPRVKHKDIYTILTPFGDNMKNLNKLYNNIY